MKKARKILPIISLSAIIAAASLSHSENTFQKYYDATPKKITTNLFIDDELSDTFEDAIKELFNTTNMVPQGISVSEDYIFISLYDYNHANNSIIQTYSKEGNIINTCALHNNAHVGGISYDKNNDIIWVSSILGNVDAYSKDDIIKKESAEPIYTNMYLGKGLMSYNNPFITAVSYLTIHDNSIFVGNYTELGKGLVKQFEITKQSDESLRLATTHYFYVPKRVQGIAFYKKDDETYMILSRSCGANRSSALQMFKYDPTITDYTSPEVSSKTFRFPPMLEQTSLADDLLYSLYESQSSPYKYKNKEDKTLKKTKINSLLEIE